MIDPLIRDFYTRCTCVNEAITGKCNAWMQVDHVNHEAEGSRGCYEIINIRVPIDRTVSQVSRSERRDSGSQDVRRDANEYFERAVTGGPQWTPVENLPSKKQMRKPLNIESQRWFRKGYFIAVPRQLVPDSFVSVPVSACLSVCLSVSLSLTLATNFDPFEQ